MLAGRALVLGHLSGRIQSQKRRREKIQKRISITGNTAIQHLPLEHTPFFVKVTITVDQ